MYKRLVWKDTLTFCRHYVYGLLRESDQRFALGPKKKGLRGMALPNTSIFEKGLLNLWGPGQKSGLLLENYGFVGGNSNSYGLGGPSGLDYSQDHALSGNTGSHMNWDLRPKQGFFLAW